MQAGDTFGSPTWPTRCMLGGRGPAPSMRAKALLGSATGSSNGAASPSRTTLAAYEVIERSPVEVPFRAPSASPNPPPSSGGILISYALDLLDVFRRAAPAGRPRRGLALLAEVMDQRSARERRSSIASSTTRFRRTLSFRSAHRGRAGTDRTLNERPRPRGSADDRIGSTTHISVLDGEGNAASVTCSNGPVGVVPPGTGIHLNNMLGEEDLNPLGFHRHEPGTRTSMMAPTVVLRGGEVELALERRLEPPALGDPAGDQVCRRLRNDDRGGAGRGRMHNESGILHVEGDFDDAALTDLERRGYQLLRWKGVNLLRRRSCRLQGPRHRRALQRRRPRRDGAAVTA